MSELRRSWLVQRLTQPRNVGIPGDNPFSFGGGLRNGGLSDEAMGLLRDVFSFDYMGAAEFEFGAVPEALSAIAKASLVAFSFTVPLAEVPASWRDKSGTKPDGEGTIYVLCPVGWEAECEARIGEWARGTEDLKEGTRLTGTLRPYEDWDAKTCGWLEISNGFMFFTDAVMWEKSCALFGVLTEATKAA